MTQSELKELTNLGAELGAAKAENDRLRGLLREAAEDVEAWGAYASEYFQEKHDLAGCAAKYRAAGVGDQGDGGAELAAIAAMPMRAALSHQGEPTDTFTAVDMATAAARGFRDGQAAVEQAPAQDETLADRMRAAGMLTIDEMLSGAPLDRFIRHAGVNDLDTYGQWLEMKCREFLSMQASRELEKREDDDLYEWVLAHAAAFQEARINFNAARPAQAEQQPVSWQFYQDGKWWNGDDRIKDHRKNTEAAGIPVRDLYAAPIAQTAPQGKFRIGDLVKRSTGSEWVGRVVGWYSTEQTPEGYAVESEAHAGSVQIYPAKALELVPMAAKEA